MASDRSSRWKFPSALIRLLEDMLHYHKIRRRYRKPGMPVAFRSSYRSVVHPVKRILFFPERPVHSSVAYKICACLGYSITTDPVRKVDAVFKYENTACSRADVLQGIVHERIINRHSLDISKRTVERVFGKTFGYTTAVDPTQYQGMAVEKSNDNATHDGRIIECPVSREQVRTECVYERLIQYEAGDGFVMHYRVPVHGHHIPLVYMKYRPLETRFNTTNERIEIKNPDEVFSEAETGKIFLFCRTMGIDFGELDIMRHRTDGKIYVVDAANTPWGPSKRLSDDLRIEAMARLSRSFEALITN